MISKPKEEMTFVLYENQKPALCYRIGKRTLRFFLVGLPMGVLVILSILIFFLLINTTWNQFNQGLISTNFDFRILKNKFHDLDQVHQHLLKKYEVLERNYYDLKRNVGPQAKRLPPNRDLFTPHPLPDHLSLEQVRINFYNGDVHISFNILNKDEGLKTSGHYFVILQTSQSLRSYPLIPFSLSQQGLSLSTAGTSGDSFTVSRLRPVKVVFKNVQSEWDQSASILVLLFNKQGNYLGQEKLK